MNSRKSQIGLRELLTTLIVAGILAIVGVMVFSKVSSTTEDIYDPDRNKERNETVAIEINAVSGTNSTLLAKAGYIENSETVANASDATETPVRGTDYVITLTAASGVLTTRANFTWINQGPNGSYNWSNTTGIFITYEYNAQSDAQASKENIEDTVLDAFELAVIALIVLAAVVILGTLFMLGGR